MFNKKEDENRITITRKVQLYPVGDKKEVSRVYTLVRDLISVFNRTLNQAISFLYSQDQLEASKEDRELLAKILTHTNKEFKNGKKGISAYGDDIVFIESFEIPQTAAKKAKDDYRNAKEKGLMKGKISLPSYNNNNPFILNPKFLRPLGSDPTNYGFYYEYASFDEFLSHLYSDLDVFIKLPQDITFKCVFGNPRRSAELRNVFKNIFDGTYDVRGSSISLKDKKIILNLGISIPKKNTVLDESLSVGVDLGLAIPAMCALSSNNFVRKAIGSKDDFIRIRQKIQAELRRLQKSLTYTSGGHGRAKKLQALERFKEYERNWVKTYNHFVSHAIVDFALKNGAKYINLEYLKGFGSQDKNKFILRNWSYYELQQQIKYKAEKYGIVVRFVNPCYTSQVCSCCGHWEEDQRVSQDTFICNNPECENYGVKVNADFNAARNIAMSKLFVDEEAMKKVKNPAETLKKEAAAYYGIPYVSDEKPEEKPKKTKRKTRSKKPAADFDAVS